MKKSPSKRPNDGKSLHSERRIPIGKTLRKMAELVLHERPKEKRPPKYKRGIGNCHAAKRKFTEAEVIDMRRRYRAGEWPSVIGASYNCATGTVRQIVNGVTYGWVVEPV